MIRRTFLCSILILISFLGYSQQISLKGNWQVMLDSAGKGKEEGWPEGKFKGQKIALPGTLDDARIGKPAVQDTTVLNKPVLLSLTRKHRYIGAAWYQRNIVLKAGLNDAEIFLERVIWKTDCWIDGRYIGGAESLSSPHNLKTGALKAGKHTIVLRIDNSKQHDISFNDFAHAYTDGTQIIWNGVIGEMKLNTIRETGIAEMQVFADVAASSVQVDLQLKDKTPIAGHQVRYQIFDQGKLVHTEIVKVSADSGPFSKKITLKQVKLWNEFEPNLYSLTVELLNQKGKTVSVRNSSFGFRQLGNQNGQLSLNGQRIFLRGTLDCNIYPVNGYPPMDKAGWVKVFKVVKDYGLNHIRYHSWCPPETAFAVADSLGLYLQVELPLWSLKVGEDKATMAFLKNETERILSSYGNHPSFCFFSMGNELEGDFNWLNALVKELKQKDPRRFYTATTFSFQKGHGLAPEPNDDFFITQYTKKGWVRGQGVFNAEVPRFDKDYQAAAEGLAVPLVAHEVGQYSVFPNLQEIKKYTGVLDPLNFKAIRNDMMKKGLYALADSFKLSSGKLAALLYKEEIERALKTKAFSGFQLLDLHDFPGQSTALVGLLDAFWESKGLISPKDFRSFCSAVVPLIKYSAASYSNDQDFKADLLVANFGKGIITGKGIWTVTDQSGKTLFSGQTATQQIKLDMATLGQVSIPLNKVTKASQLTFKLAIENTDYNNSWTFWVYPKELPAEDGKVLFTKSKDEALKALALGRTVVLNPDTANINGVPGRFTSVFWSPVHFPDQPGSMGIMCNPGNPVFASFPTTFHSNWQWWDLISNSKTLVLDNLTEAQLPMVRVIDNFYKNRNMGSLIEAQVGTGKLILCTMDIHTDIEKRIAARQLRSSIMSYAAENSFAPKQTVSVAEINQWIK
jgi:hypothetical protein